MLCALYVLLGAGLTLGATTAATGLGGTATTGLGGKLLHTFQGAQTQDLLCNLVFWCTADTFLKELRFILN